MTRHMKHHILSLAIACGLVLTLTACQERKEPSEPGFTARSANGDLRITDEKQLAELRKVTDRFHSIEVAKKAGYSTQITPCWAHHSAGAMGYHFGNTNL